MRAETIDRFSEEFACCGFRREAFYPCYGLAEATLMVSGARKSSQPVIRPVDAHALQARRVASSSARGPAAKRVVGCGQVVSGDVAIVDPETLERCASDRVGEIWVRNKSVAQGYWRREAETEDVFHARPAGISHHEYLRTGDLGFLSRGELFVVGRIKDLLIIRGCNHYPQDIERTVEASHHSVRASCCAAFTIEEPDQRLVVACEVDRRPTGTTDEIFAAIRGRVSHEHDLRVDSVVLLTPGSLPKTSSGKVQRRLCRELLIAGRLAIVARSDDARPDGGSLLATILETIEQIAKERGARVSLDSDLSELGLDSLERVEMLAALEAKFGGRFPEHVLSQLVTCRDLADAAARYLANDEMTGQPAGTGIRPEHYCFECSPEFVRLRQTLHSLDQAGIVNPYFTVHQRVTNDTTLVDGQELINFSSYNYLGMSGDPLVSEAAKAAIDQFGTSASASRLASGEKTIHRELETQIATLVGAEDAIAYVGGHSTNETTIGHLFGANDLILHDALAHNSIVQGAVLSGACRRSFPHNDWCAADRLLTNLRAKYQRVLIAIEGAYSMDGDIPDLRRFIELKQRHKTFLMVDEAHSIGVLGEQGRGIGEYWQTDSSQVDMWMGTLSKAFGSCGGYIAGRKTLVEYLKYTAPGFVYSVGISPSNAAAALAAIDLLRREPERVARLHARAELFLSLAKRHGLNTGRSHDTPVIPLIVGDSMKCLRWSQALRQRGINVQPIVHPAVEEASARLRFFVTSTHTEEQIRFAATTAAATFARLA